MMSKKVKRGKHTLPNVYAVVDKGCTHDWKHYFRWSDSINRVDNGHFKTIEEAINAVPEHIKKILVQYHDGDTMINKIIER